MRRWRAAMSLVGTCLALATGGFFLVRAYPEEGGWFRVSLENESEAAPPPTDATTTTAAAPPVPRTVVIAVETRRMREALEGADILDGAGITAHRAVWLTECVRELIGDLDYWKRATKEREGALVFNDYRMFVAGDYALGEDQDARARAAAWVPSKMEPLKYVRPEDVFSTRDRPGWQLTTAGWWHVAAIDAYVQAEWTLGECDRLSARVPPKR